MLAGPPRVIRNSKASSTAHAFFEIYDSQSGQRAKRLINKTFMFRGRVILIRPAVASVGVPLCTRCWRWGHPKTSCKACQPICARCSGPHELEVHRIAASCCKPHPEAKPPTKGTPLASLARCPSCHKDHWASSSHCSFWRHRFDRPWIEAKYAEVRDFWLNHRPTHRSHNVA
ncbi:hypothetical protein BDZ97DRAFT_1664522 [Flammula alnicola]|nr:hypothetical protein BDZ97DRAFT_1664522 [Flammula alnicola]